MGRSTLRIRVPALGPRPVPINDPHERGIRLGRLLWRPLLDVSSSVTRPLATEVDVASNGDLITISLDPSAQWSDGSPVIADQVAATAACTLPSTIAVRVDSGRVTLRGPGAAKAATRVTPVRSVDGRLDTTVTTGPYTVDELSTARAKLIRTSRDSALPDVVEIIAVADPDAALAALRRAELDVLLEADESTVAEVIATSEFAAVALPDSARLVQVLGFNLDSAAVADRDTRRRLARAVDRDTLAREVYLGLARPAPAPASGAHGGPLDCEVSVLVNAENRLRVASAKRILADWMRVGIHGRLDIEVWATFVNRLQSGDFDTFLLSVREDGSEIWPSSSGQGLLGGFTRYQSEPWPDRDEIESDCPATNVTHHASWLVLEAHAIRHIPLVVAAAGGGIAC